VHAFPHVSMAGGDRLQRPESPLQNLQHTSHSGRIDAMARRSLLTIIITMRPLAGAAGLHRRCLGSNNPSPAQSRPVPLPGQLVPGEASATSSSAMSAICHGPAPPPTALNDLERSTWAMRLMAVHRHSYTSLQLTQQGGPAEEDEASKGKASAPNEFGVSLSSLPTPAQFVQRLANARLANPARRTTGPKLTRGQIE
jgi:hypothetical protein